MTATITMTIDKKYAGKVAVITGGSRNIGKAIAVELARNGAKIVIGDIRDADGDATVRELNELAGGQEIAAYIHTDVTKYADNSALFKLAETKFGGVDYAIFSAGIGTNANTMFLPFDDKLDERMLDINTTAVIKGNKVAMLYLAKRGGGSIINIASAAGLRSRPALGIYCASKFGVVGWVKSCDVYKDVCNVRVNAVCPTFIQTELADDLSNATDEDPFAKLVQKMAKVPMNYVVDTVTKFIQEEERNAQTLVVLPDGIHLYEAPNPYGHIAAHDPGYAEGLADYSKESIAYFKKRLAEAREREGI